MRSGDRTQDTRDQRPETVRGQRSDTGNGQGQLMPMKLQSLECRDRGLARSHFDGRQKAEACLLAPG